MSRDTFSAGERRYFARRARDDDESDGEPRRDLGRETIALAVVAAIGLGVGTGNPSTTLGVILSTLVVVACGTRLDAAAPARLALASFGVVAGLLAVAGAATVALPGQPIAVLGAVAVGSTAAALRLEGAAVHAFVRVLRDSLFCGLVVGIALGAIAFGGVQATALVLASIVDLLTVTPFVAFASALALSVVALFSIDPLAPYLESTPLSVPDGVPSVGDFLEWVLDLPTGVYYLLAIGGFAIAIIDVAGAFESALASLGPVGTAVTAILVSGVLHAVAGIVLLTAATVLAGSALEVPVRLWLGSYPLRTLALGTGGAVVTVVLALATAVSSALPAATTLGGLYGLLAVAFLVVAATSGVVSMLGLSAERCRRYALALGASATALATALAALDGLEPLFIFAGVAVAVLLWDLGENALTAGTRLGRGADTREPELVHATGSVLVGGLGIGVAAVATYVVGHVPPPAERWQAVAPLALAVLAATIFLLVARGDVRSSLGNRGERSSRSLPASGFAEVHIFTGVAAVCALFAIVLGAGGQTVGASIAIALGVPFAVLVAFDRLAALFFSRW